MSYHFCVITLSLSNSFMTGGEAGQDILYWAPLLRHTCRAPEEIKSQCQGMYVSLSATECMGSDIVRANTYLNDMSVPLPLIYHILAMVPRFQ